MIAKIHSLPVILSVAGSDSSGGAGIQADLRAIAAHGCFGATAITAVTAQNTCGVEAVHTLPPSMVVSQIRAVTGDMSVAAVKTGMLGERDVVEAVAAECRRIPEVPLVVDPVMVSTSGAALLKDDAVDALVRELFPLATLVTPNRAEVRALTGVDPTCRDTSLRAAQLIAAMGPRAVLIKGGHGDSPDTVTDLLWMEGGVSCWSFPRLETVHTHGTGCTLASSVAAQLGRGRPMRVAIDEARHYLQGAIERGLAIGRGHGPTDHFWWLKRERRFAPTEG